jgi:DNA mismatch endonuclease (patch repair protein)
LETNKLRDARNVEQLRGVGWDSLIVWQCETADAEALLKRLTAFLAKAKNPIDTGSELG